MKLRDTGRTQCADAFFFDHSSSMNEPVFLSLAGAAQNPQMINAYKLIKYTITVSIQTMAP